MTGASYIGFGEAAAAFARSGDRAFDIKTFDEASAGSKRADYRAVGVRGCESAEEALQGSAVVLSLVTADQALAAVMDHAPFVARDALWLDMNSVAPGTKRAASFVIEAVGARYVDVAIMAPVHPARHAVPLLVSGPHRAAATEALGDLGFNDVRDGGSRIGDASAVKMIRSVLVKGLEALTAEAAMAADRAGVFEAVFASLDASWKEQSWAARADYNLDRAMAHGKRRASEMEEVARTLCELGIDPAMTRAAESVQRAIGALDLAPPEGIDAKLALLAPGGKERAA